MQFGIAWLKLLSKIVQKTHFLPDFCQFLAIFFKFLPPGKISNEKFIFFQILHLIYVQVNSFCSIYNNFTKAINKNCPKNAIFTQFLSIFSISWFSKNFFLQKILFFHKIQYILTKFAKFHCISITIYWVMAC